MQPGKRPADRVLHERHASSRTLPARRGGPATSIDQVPEPPVQELSGRRRSSACRFGGPQAPAKRTRAPRRRPAGSRGAHGRAALRRGAGRRFVRLRFGRVDCGRARRPGPAGPRRARAAPARARSCHSAARTRRPRGSIPPAARGSPRRPAGPRSSVGVPRCSRISSATSRENRTRKRKGLSPPTKRPKVWRK